MMGMTCHACNYQKYVDHYRNEFEDESVNPDGPDFIELVGMTFFRDVPPEERGWGQGDKREVRLYACPQCGTVRMEE